MLYVLIIVLIMAALFAGLIYENIRDRKQRERDMQESYGRKRSDADTLDVLDRMEWIRILYDLEKEGRAESSLVDEITWNDLDMDRIFALTDHTDSYAGEQCLYAKMRDLSAEKTELELLEKRIGLFCSDEEKRRKVRKKLYYLGKSYADYDLPLLMDQLEYHRLGKPWVYYLLSGALTVSAVCAAVFRDPAAIGVLIGMYLINMTVHIVKMTKMDEKIKSLWGIGRMLGTAIEINDEVPELDPDAHVYLDPLKNAVRKASALELGRPGSSTDEFSLMRSYLLGPFMLDFIIYNKVITELCTRQDDCFKAYRLAGEADCAIALSSYRKTVSHCVPEFTDSDSFSFGAVVDPLIENAVANDISYDRDIILTGSNASGKSTFVKAVAVNLILGQTIHTCTAESAVIPKCCVMTSMNVRDDIISGESYYLREIRYLKRMIDMCAEDRLLFLAIDEILKGTNTKERIAASGAVMEYLRKRRCMFIVATHDLELAGAFDGVCDNCHFSEVIGSDDVEFDYILRKGISNSSNAIKLLEAMDFPKEIVDSASERAGG